MKKDLLDELLEKPQRETAGADSSSRFDYQKSWAFCEMLRRHMDEADYLVAFEFHDDTVFLSPSGTPTNAEFYQVKTSKSPNARKLAAFTLRPKNSNSILGKMFQNFEGICAKHAIKVILVSNVAFEFSDQSICAKDLAPKFRDKIKARLTEELSEFSEMQLDNLHFFVTGVSIGAMHSFLHGEAMALFKARFGEDHGLNVYSWVRLLQSEIARKNNFPSDEIKTVDELMSKKCIAAKFVDDSLTLVHAQRKTPPDMNLVSSELKAAGWSLIDIMRLSKKMPQAAADHTDSTNLEAMKIVERLVSIFHNQSNAVDLAKFVALAEQELLADLPAPYNDLAYLAALSVMVFHEEI